MNKELKALEALNELVYGEENIKGTDVEKHLYEIIEIDLKTLKIIIEKQVDIHFLLTCLNTPIIDLKLQTISIEKQLEMYNSSVINNSTFIPDTSRCLNKEEFDLLKEILL